MPYLDRDEPEVYLWMFFNAWVACYREEINAMVEHPYPELGYANTAHPKTSDEANAVMWLRYLFVYGPESGLYLGRAIPRAWLGGAEADRPGECPDPMGRGQRSLFPGGGERHITARVDLKHTTHRRRRSFASATPTASRSPALPSTAGSTVRSMRRKGRRYHGLDGALDIVARY